MSSKLSEYQRYRQSEIRKATISEDMSATEVLRHAMAASAINTRASVAVIFSHVLNPADSLQGLVKRLKELRVSEREAWEAHKNGIPLRGIMSEDIDSILEWLGVKQGLTSGVMSTHSPPSPQAPAPPPPPL